MKNLSFVKLVVLMVLIGMISCTNEDVYVGDTSISSLNDVAVISDIPFADEQALAEIASNSAFVPYNIARKLAVVEMELSINESMNWHGTKLGDIVPIGKWRFSDMIFLIVY